MSDVGRFCCEYIGLVSKGDTFYLEFGISCMQDIALLF